MRLLELEIFNFRGVRQLSITPGGENFVIWGPNGSGKSAVVDALDFLLAGHISRLTGEGTGDIQLTRHGPHIDSDPASALVRGRFRLSRDGAEATIARTVEHANSPVLDDDPPEELQLALAAASKGQHVLSRREILKYITSDAGTRASEIQALLNLRDIEAIRKTLVTVKNESQREADESYRRVERGQATVATTASIDAYGAVPLLQVLNGRRELLAGTTIGSVESAQIKTGLTPPTDRPETPVTQVAMTGAIERLNACITTERLAEVVTVDNELRRLLEAARNDPNARQALEILRLTELGLGLLGDDERCPLCEKPWAPGELRDYLAGRVKTAAAVNEAANQISELSIVLRGIVNHGLAAAQDLRRLTERAGITDGSAELNAWTEDLRCLSDALGNPLSDYVPDVFSADAVQRLVGPEDVAGVLLRVQDGATNCAQAPSPQQEQSLLL